jgi:hypothetical protein
MKAALEKVRNKETYRANLAKEYSGAAISRITKILKS